MTEPERDSPRVRDFRDAQDRFATDLRALLSVHRDALGGQMGMVHALVEMLGSVCVGLLQDLGTSPEADIACRHLAEKFSQLMLYVATARSKPQ